MRQLRWIKFICAVCLLCLPADYCLASDWGYEDPQPARPLRAQAQPLAVPASEAPSVVPRKPSTVGKGSKPVGSDNDTLTEECWVAIYELAGHQKLDNEQRAQLHSLLVRKLNGGAALRQDARSVVAFWPKLAAYLVAHPQQADSYASLLRALFRFKARHQADELYVEGRSALAQDECALIMSVLGAQSLSVPGTVPFSEDAINAYADMACFIYEQRNPGKSVDALDNRAVFATVVSQKFKDAPTKKDKEAMAGFDLTWAKFKIVWTDSDDKQRAMLLSDLAASGASAAWAKAHDNMLELVLHCWPAPISKDASAVSSEAANPHK